MFEAQSKKIALEELNLNDLVKALIEINPEFAGLVEELMGDEEYTFYKASYPFGARIIEKGKFYLPFVEGGSIAIDDPDLPDNLRRDLGYGSSENPLALVLENAAEFYLPSHQRIQPHLVLRKGQMFGIPRAIDTNTGTTLTSTSALIYNLNAGARSVFMLPKISDQINHAKLQEYCGTQLPLPMSTQDHWKVFANIAKQMSSKWRFVVLYFPRNWINKLKTREWAELAHLLQRLHRESYNILHNMSAIWNNTFHDIEQERYLSNYPMPSLDTAKHLFFLAANSALGFKPATTDELAPFSVIKEAYLNGYNKIARQKYAPIIMEPTGFNVNDKSPIYYSLNNPTFAQNNLDGAKKKSQLSWLEEVRFITESYLKVIIEEKKHIESLYNAVKDVNFSYYHSDPQNYANITNAGLLEKEDPRFMKGQEELFPTNGAFFKGCIKISAKD